MAYAPSDRDLWQKQQAAIKERNRRIEADRKEAARIQSQMVKDELAHRKAMQKMQQDAIAQIEREAAAEEKSILSEPRTRYTGATRKNPRPIIVWHHAAEPPRDLDMKQRRRGSGPLLALRPGGGAWRTEDAIYASLKRRFHGVADEFPEYAAAVQKALNETTTAYPILTVLRDDKKMRDVFAAAGVNMSSDGSETLTGTYGAYKRKVTTINVPSLTDVVIGTGGLELTYAHRLGDSAKNWNSKIDTLRNAFRSLGVNPEKLTVTESAGGDIVIKFNDRDPLSDPLPQVIHSYDPERGRSYLGKAADGSDIYLTINNNACVIVGGMQGGGKTASLLPMLVGMAGHVEMHVLDGGASGEWSVLEPVCATYDESGEIDACGELMKRLLDTRAARLKKIASVGAGAINFWDIPAATREAAGLYPIVVIIEEAPQYMGKAQDTSDEKKVAEQNRGRVGKAVKLLRKAGVTIFIVAQKPTDDEVPTTARDMGSQRLCFRLDSDVAAQTVLGDSAHKEPKPTSIPSGKPGRFVARVDGRGNLLGQAVYVPIDDLQAAMEGKKPVVTETAVVGDPVETDTAPVGPVAVDTRSQPLSSPSIPAPGKPALSDDELIAALAEATRRGILKKPAVEEPVIEQPTPTPRPTTTGFDF